MVGWTTKGLFALGRVECGTMRCEVSKVGTTKFVLTLPVVMLNCDCEFQGSVVYCKFVASQLKMRLIGGSIESTVHRLELIG